MRRNAQRLPPLDLLHAFEAVARHASFTKAGAERCVTQSAISKQVRSLEDDLGVVLFDRRHRALALTDEGRRLYETCSVAFALLKSTLQRVGSTDPRPCVAFTTTPALAALWLIPRLPRFIEAHPEMDVHLDTNIAVRDLKAEGFDLSIRYDRVDAAHGAPLFRESMLPVCSPRLVADRTHPLEKPLDLRLHTLLQVTVPSSSTMPLEWDPWLQAMGVAELRPAAMLSFSNYEQAIEAAVQGQGVALGRLPLVERLLKSGKLVAPFPRALASPRAYFLIVEPQARAKPAVQALETWLLEQARDPPGAVGRTRPARSTVGRVTRGT